MEKNLSIEDIIENFGFLKNIELDPWILANILVRYGKIKYRYQIACIIADMNLILYYIDKRKSLGDVIEKRINELIKEINECIKCCECAEELIVILSEYKVEYERRRH